MFERKGINGLGKHTLLVVPEDDIALATLRQLAGELLRQRFFDFG
jgi:hypothetical protein